MRESCEVCKFYEPYGNGEEGRCRRHPPTMRFPDEYPINIEENRIFPVTHSDEWCGEFKGLVT